MKPGLFVQVLLLAALSSRGASRSLRQGPDDGAEQPCSDESELCKSMSRTCEGSATVRKKCPLSCGVCGEGTPAVDPDGDKTPAPSTCLDSVGLCETALEYCGHRMVADMCPATCGECAPPLEECFDDNPLCETAGECDDPVFFDTCPNKCTGECRVVPADGKGHPPPDFDTMLDEHEGGTLIVPCKTCAVAVYIDEGGESESSSD